MKKFEISPLSVWPLYRKIDMQYEAFFEVWQNGNINIQDSIDTIAASIMLNLMERKY